MKYGISIALVLSLTASLLSSCGKDSSKSVISDTAKGLLEDTHMTEYGTEEGTEKETEIEEFLVVEASEGETDQKSEVVQETSSETAGQETPAAGQETPAAGQETSAAGQETSAPESQTAGGTEVAETTPQSEETMAGPFAETGILDLIKGREALGEAWSLAYEDLEGGSEAGYQETAKMQSASVIKLFIMGAVYQYMCYPEHDDEMINFGESYDGELRDTIERMITVSDNEAANLLVERLGKGDFAAGEEIVNSFCRKNGYSETSLGRRFMASDLSQGDNFTSAADVRKFYSDIYHGKLVNEEASAKMLEIVKGQTLKNKIPAGLPQGFTSGNKTGEMPGGYGLGEIENDSAIIFPPEGSGKGYILVVLSNDLGGKNSEAQGVIADISGRTAQWYLGGNSETASSGQ